MSRSIALTSDTFENVVRSFARVSGDVIFYTKTRREDSVWMLCVRAQDGDELDD